MARKKIRVLFSRRAERDLSEIYRFLSDRASHALPKVDIVFTQAFRRLASFPLSGHWVKEFAGRRYREILVFHYRVIYRFFEKENKLRILTIHHGRRFLPKLL